MKHAVLALTLSFSGATAHAQQVRVLAMTGTDGPLGPGLGSGVVFDSFDNALVNPCLTINQRSEVAFTADLSGAGFLGAPLLTDSVWRERGQGPELVVIAGEEAPSTQGLIFGSFFQTTRVFANVLLNADGDIAFTALLGNPDGSALFSPSTDTGIWISIATMPTPPTLAVREGDPVNALAPATVGLITAPVMNDSPSVAFATRYGVGPLQGVIGAAPGGAAVSIIETQHPVPGVPGATFDGPFEDVFTQLRRASSDLAFRGRFSGIGVTESDDTGVFVTDGLSGRLVAREGAPAPDTDAAFAEIHSIAASNAGTTALIADLSGGTPSSAIFREPVPGELRAVAVQGQPALGLPGHTFVGFGPQSAFAMSSSGALVFQALAVQGSFPFSLTSGVWLGSDLPAIVAKAGDNPPGAGPNASFLEFGTVAAGGEKAAFTASWQADPSSAPAGGVWGVTPNGQLVKLLAAGDQVSPVPGDTRTVSSFEIVPNRGDGDGRAASMNADGWLIGIATFTDGQSAILTVRVPDAACIADLAAPFGTLNFFDVSAFIGLFNAQSSDADLAAPFGVWNFFDLSTYMSLYADGCP